MNNSVIKKLFILSLGLLALLILFSCEKKEEVGHFEIIDGVETYVYDGQIIKNQLVEVNGDLYYVDANGHKLKDEWAIIDNDGHYGYFGNLGDLVRNKIRTIDGKDYYFDEKGCLYQDRTESKIKIIEGTEYIANVNGELSLAANKINEVNNETTAKVKQTTNKTVQQEAKTTTQQSAVTQQSATTQQAAAQQAAAQAAAQQAAAQAAANAAAQQAALQAAQASQVSTNPPFANAINITNVDTSVPDETGGPGVVGFTPTVAQNTAPGGNSVANAETTAQASNEVKILRTEKMVEEIDGEDYSCKITLLKPIMNGSTVEETNAINDSIDELIESWYDEVAGIVNDYDVLPRSVTFSKATLGTVSKSKINISIEGTIRPKSGSSKNIKYRIIYDRNEQISDISKVGS